MPLRVTLLAAHLACAIALSFSPRYAVGQSTTSFAVGNPEFEGTYIVQRECANITGEVASHWTDNTCWDANHPIIHYVRETASPHSGGAAQRITLSSGSRVQFGQFFATPFQANERYTVSVWLRAQTPQFVTLLLRQSASPYSGYTSKLIKLSTVWTRFEFDGVAESAAGALLVLATTPGTFWVDDLAVQSSPAQVVYQPPPIPVPHAFFGMHLNYADTPWPAVRNAVGSMRIWDASGSGGYT